MIQLVKNDALVMPTNQLKTTRPPAVQSVSKASYLLTTDEVLNQLTRKLNVGEENGEEAGNQESPPGTSLGIDSGETFGNELLVGHASENSRRQVHRLGGNCEDTSHHASVQNGSNGRNASLLHGNDERRGRNTTATQQAWIVGWHKEGDEDDAKHVDKVDTERHEFCGVGHGEARALGFASHDTNEDLVTNSPNSKESAIGKSSKAVEEYWEVRPCLSVVHLAIRSRSEHHSQ